MAGRLLGKAFGENAEAARAEVLVVPVERGAVADRAGTVRVAQQREAVHVAGAGLPCHAPQIHVDRCHVEGEAVRPLRWQGVRGGAGQGGLQGEAFHLRVEGRAGADHQDRRAEGGQGVERGLRVQMLALPPTCGKDHAAQPFARGQFCQHLRQSLEAQRLAPRIGRGHTRRLVQHDKRLRRIGARQGQHRVAPVAVADQQDCLFGDFRGSQAGQRDLRPADRVEAALPEPRQVIRVEPRHEVEITGPGVVDLVHRGAQVRKRKGRAQPRGGPGGQRKPDRCNRCQGRAAMAQDRGGCAKARALAHRGFHVAIDQVSEKQAHQNATDNRPSDLFMFAGVTVTNNGQWTR